MIYIVSGYMRTGTTMMMRALEAGGMPAYYEDELYELPKDEIARAVLNPHTIDGKLFKCIAGGLLRLAAWKYKIIFMQRHYSEIKSSCDNLFGADTPLCSEKDFHQLMRYTAGVIDQRRDMQWTGIQYRAVLEDPLAVFELLKKHGGWPIDTGKAAAVVDPNMCHHKAA